MNFWTDNNEDLALALPRTTHLAIAAHPDDVELMAPFAVSETYNNDNKYLTVIIVTDGSGYPPHGDKEELIKTRQEEQIAAAKAGHYNAVIFLNFASSDILALRSKILSDLLKYIKRSSPKYIFLHNPFDQHITHVKCSYIALTAIYQSKMQARIFACPVWGDMEWIENKVSFDLSKEEKLIRAIITPFKSQLQDKRYDQALLHRLQANATFAQQRQADSATLLAYAIDLTAIYEKGIAEYLQELLDHYYQKQKKNMIDFLPHLS